MTEEDSPLFESEKRNWLMTFAKILFVLTAIFLVAATVLSRMGGSNDTLKASVTDFTTKLFRGHPAQIDTLVHMSFFPRVGVDLEGLKVMSVEKANYPLVQVDKLQFFMGFWNVTTGTPRFSRIYVEGGESVKGFLTPQELRISKIFVDHDVEGNNAVLRGGGMLGAHDWSVAANIGVHGRKGKYSYQFEDRFVLRADLADIVFDSTFVSHEGDFFKFDDFILTLNERAIHGDIVLSSLGNKQLKLKGAVSSTSSPDPIDYDLVMDLRERPVKVSLNTENAALRFEEVITDPDTAFILKYILNIWSGVEQE